MTDTLFKLSAAELAECGLMPDTLRLLADWHDARSCEAETIGFDAAAQAHTLRALELKAEALRIESTY